MKFGTCASPEVCNKITMGYQYQIRSTTKNGHILAGSQPKTYVNLSRCIWLRLELPSVVYTMSLKLLQAHFFKGVVYFVFDCT